MNRRLRVMLVTAPYHAGVVESAGVWMPLQFVYLAGHARRAGAEVLIHDAMSRFDSHADVARAIADFRPDLVGVSAFTASEPDAREVCRSAKRIDPRIVTVLGNVHASFMWREILSEEPDVDVIVRGEGEGSIEDLVRALSAGAPLDAVPGLALRKDGRPIATPPRPFLPDLDALEPAWDLIDWPRYFYRPRPEGRFAIVASSRGCNQRCSFCSQQKLWERSWRSRAPEKFVSELEMLRDRFGVRVAMLADETPTVNPRRWHRILELLRQRQAGVELLMETRVDDVVRDEALLDGYRGAGVSHLYVGVESGRQETLDLFKKDVLVGQSKRAIDLINGAGIVSETSFVLGLPEETPQSVKATVDLAKWYAPDMAFFLALAPWPYADLYPQLRHRVVSHDYRKYNLVEPVIEPYAMSLDELRAALFRATGDFFHDKFARIGEMSAAKRTYMLQVLKLLIENSYLGEHMHEMASRPEMPEAVARMLAEIDRVELPSRHSARPMPAPVSRRAVALPVVR